MQGMLFALLRSYTNYEENSVYKGQTRSNPGTQSHVPHVGRQAARTIYLFFNLPFIGAGFFIYGGKYQVILIFYNTVSS